MPQPTSYEEARKRRLLSVCECAAQLGVSTRTVRRLVSKGTLLSVRLGRSIRIPITSVEALIERGGGR